MAGKRKNGEGSWGKKKIHGDEYFYYRNADGRYFYGRTEKDVKAKIKESKTRKQSEKKNTQEMTFGEYVLVWLESIRTGIEATTYQSYLDAVNARLINYKAYNLSNVKLSELSDKMFQDYLNSLAEKYSLNSIKKVWGLIKTCVQYAEAKKDIKPLYLKVTVTTPSEANVSVKKKDISIPSAEEVQMIYEEAIGPQWKDVDIERREIAVNQSLAMIREDKAGKSSYSYKVKAAKTKDSRRKIVLPDKAVEALKYFKQYYTDDNDFVCVNAKNQNHYTRRQIERSMERIVENSRCQTKNYTPHSLRHGYGSILLSMGTDIKIVSELLGHSDVSFTYNVYIGIFDRDKHDAVMKLN